MIKAKDGTPLFTQSWRVDDPGAVVVLTHGHGEHANRYLHVGRAFTAAGYSAYAYDLRGHGRSGGPRGHAPGYETILDDLQSIIDWARAENPGRRMFLYGHSTGGQITLNFALRRKPDVAGVIASSAWLRLVFVPPPWKIVLGRVLARVWPGFAMPKGLENTHMSHDLQWLEAQRDPKLSCDVLTARMAVEFVAAGEDAIRRAPELALPLLMLHGSADDLTDPAATRLFYERAGSTDKTYRLYDGLYHELHNETDRQTVLQDITSWLNQRSGGTQ